MITDVEKEYAYQFYGTYFPRPETLSPWDIWLQKHIENCPKFGCLCIRKICELREKGY